MLDWWYWFTDTILPFQWAGHTFMKNALLAVLLVTPLFGILGTMVVNNKMAFFSDSLGHGAFTGIAAGSAIGLVKPIWAAIIFSILFAITITIIKNKSRASTDTVIGVFSSTAVALGIVLISLNLSPNKYVSYLIGDLLSITPSEIMTLTLVFAGVMVLWLLLFNKLLLISINRALAGSRRVNTLLIEILFTSAVAVVVTVSIQWVGLLLINSLLVLPAAASRNMTVNVRQYHLASVLIAVFSGVSGVIVSYYLNTATGATIVLITSTLFFITLTLRNRFA